MLMVLEKLRKMIRMCRLLPIMNIDLTTKFSDYWLLQHNPWPKWRSRESWIIWVSVCVFVLPFFWLEINQNDVLLGSFADQSGWFYLRVFWLTRFLDGVLNISEKKTWIFLSGLSFENNNNNIIFFILETIIVALVISVCDKIRSPT